jgi:hypothetical protein
MHMTKWLASLMFLVLLVGCEATGENGTAIDQNLTTQPIEPTTWSDLPTTFSSKEVSAFKVLCSALSSFNPQAVNPHNYYVKNEACSSAQEVYSLDLTIERNTQTGLLVFESDLSSKKTFFQDVILSQPGYVMHEMCNRMAIASPGSQVYRRTGSGLNNIEVWQVLLGEDRVKEATGCGDIAALRYRDSAKTACIKVWSLKQELQGDYSVGSLQYFNMITTPDDNDSALRGLTQYRYRMSNICQPQWVNAAKLMTIF